MAKIISELTAEQELKCDEVADRWIANALSTAPADHARAEEGVRLAYIAAELEPPEVRWVNTPIEGIDLIKSLTGAQNMDYGSATGSSVGWLSRCAFYREVLGLVEETEQAVGLMLAAENCSWWWLYDKVAVLCERPTMLEVDRNGIVSRIAWGDYRQWYLNGVDVEEWMFEDDTSQWTPKTIMAVQNVDQRREVLRRYGHDRMWKVAEVIDRSEDGQYQLGVFKGVWESDRTALWMVNQSLPDTFHVEFVAPECTTVQGALTWRASRLKHLKGDWSPEVTT